MADPFQRLIQELAKQTPGIRGEGRAEWGANTKGIRPKIREAIQTAGSWNESDLSLLSDLEAAPRPYSTSVSISHTHDFGGWISVPRPTQIGWDIEIKARIKDSIIERVCAAEEIAKAPKKSYLWCAKEAFFKALEDDQPDVLVQLTVSDWSQIGENLWKWKGLGPRNGAGLLIESDSWILAGCLIC